MGALRNLTKAAILVAMLLVASWLALAGRWHAMPAIEQGNPTQHAAPVQALAALAGSAKAEMMIPVAGVHPEQLVDTFTQARANGERRHDAIDIMAVAGTPVVAAAEGRVERLFNSKDGGNTIYVRSPDRRRLYYYAHLQSYAPRLGEGASVRPGTPLGTVGATGNADPAAPHLHFAVWEVRPESGWWENGAALNPYPLLIDHPSESTAR